MKNIYTESVIPLRSSVLYPVLMVLLVCGIVCSVLLMLLVGLLGLIVTGLQIWLLWWVMRRRNREYEYIHANETFDVDILYSGSKRKHLATVYLDHVAVVARADSDLVDRYRNLKQLDYAANAEPERRYAMVYSSNGRQYKILLNLDEPMLTSLKRWMPQKVK